MLRVNQLHGFGGNRRVNFKRLAIGAYTLPSNGTSITFSSIDFGSGGTVVVAFVRSNVAGDTAAISTITVNGAAASLDVKAVASGTPAADSMIYRATSVPSGVGDLTFNFTTSRRHLIIYGAYFIGQRTLQATDSYNNNNNSMTDAVNVSADGVVIAAALHAGNNSGMNFSGGVDTDIRDIFQSTNRPGMVGHRQYPIAATPASITSTGGGNVLLRTATASYS